ncbi:PAS domain-containing protein [Colwellia sp. BRX10-6]|uniref:PAS domain-containing protein n=1 Tax=unclassified Colwellia TaxID=196834 RepID=UPI0015F5BC59|nr:MULTISPECIES: PAS domain-containing protein [unclassified Colwellia]MBA6383671.1 PAS domain-containing protein [Colwellia sp. BRX10-9]MBA6394381.1 PAS domain-containing protein [Colwellia sp. BRX10-6]
MDNSKELQVQIQYALIEKLSKSQQAHAKLLSLLDECIFECDNNFTLTYLNSAWNRQLGYTDNELLGCALPTYLHEKSKESFCNNMAETACEKSDPKRVEVLLRDKSGEYRWFEMRMVRNAEEGFIGSLFDIQAHKDMETRLRFKEEARKLSLVASHTNNLVIITNECGEVEWVNRSFEKLSGYSFEEIKGQRPGKLLQGPMTDQNVVTVMSEAIKNKENFNVEIINYNRDGEPYWIAMDASPVKSKNGQVSHYIAVQSDITQRVKAEQLASAAEYSYRLVVDNISEVVLRLQPDGRIAFMNHAWSDLIKLPESQCMGKEITEFVSGVNQPIVIKALNQFANGVHNTCRLELQMRCAGGSHTWAEMSMTPIVDQNGALIAIAATLVDVDERVAAAYALKEAKQHAETLAVAKSRFLANISHEIRTPLNAMIGSSEILQDTGLNQEQQRFADMIQSSGSALLSILDDVLTYSRFEANAVTLEHRKFDLGICIDEAIDILSDSAVKKKLKLILCIDANVPMNVIGDNVRLRQILINLLANAIKFTSIGEINIHVAYKPTENNQGVLSIKVIDTGIGIAEEKMSQLFEPFMQSDVSTTRQFGGSGLGLAICHQICEAAGGTIRVNSKLDKGSTFCIEIPIEIDISVPQNQLPSLPDNRNNIVWLIGNDNNLNDAIKQIFKRYKVTYKVFRSTSELPDPSIGLADFLVVTEPAQSDSCRKYLKPYFSDGSTPCLIILDLLGSGKFTHWHSKNELLVNGPIKVSHISRILEQLHEMLGKASIKLYDALSVNKSDINFDNATILVVEDNQQNQIIIEQFLISCGCQVLIANQGVEALRMLKNSEIDLVLMDIQMPVMDGLTTTTHIRSSDEHFKHVPIIAVTADAVYGDKERYMKAGMNDFLPKPVIRKELHRLLIKYLPEHKKQKNNETKVQRLLKMRTLVAKCLL